MKATAEQGLRKTFSKLKKIRRTPNRLHQPERKTSMREQIQDAGEELPPILCPACRISSPEFPNMPHASVPVGRSADDNVEVRRWGTAARSLILLPSRIGILARTRRAGS